MFRKLVSQSINRVDVYTDAYIALDRPILFLSIFGGAMEVKAASAQIIQGCVFDVLDENNHVCHKLIRSAVLRSITTVLAKGKATHKIMFNPHAFTPWRNNDEPAYGVGDGYMAFGKTIEEAQRHLFKMVDLTQDVPLSPAWSNWLWNKGLQRIDPVTCEETESASFGSYSYDQLVVYGNRPEFKHLAYFRRPFYGSNFTDDVVQALQAKEITIH